MRNCRFLHCVSLLVGIVALAAFSVVPSSIAVPQETETFRALAQSTTTGISGQTSIIIQITRWSTEEEVDHLRGVLLRQDMHQLADELQKQDEVGHIRVPGQAGTGWRLRYARQYRDGDTRYITLATDRPIDFWEALEQPIRTWNYRVSLIELVLDENDRGQGAMAVGVEFGVDVEHETFTIKHIATQPVRLTNVRK